MEEIKALLKEYVEQLYLGAKGDHDLLIRLEQGQKTIEGKLDQIIKDHEDRIRKVEDTTTKLKTYGAVVVFLISVLVKVLWK